jgi:hypothetical protein
MKITIHNFMKIITHDFTARLFAGAHRSLPKHSRGACARAHDIQARLMQDTELTVHMIARQEHASANYVYRLLRIPSLAPDIITAIINGKNPPQLTAKRLMRLTPQIPVLSENHIRTYWWCSPARIGMATMAPDRWTAR